MKRRYEVMSTIDKIYTIGIAIFGVIVVGYVITLSIAYVLM